VARLDSELRKQPPPLIFVRPCPACRDTDWFIKPIAQAAVYRRDEERDGWLIYVYTDESLGRDDQVAEREREPAGTLAGGRTA
jgi:hypothetical protein